MLRMFTMGFWSLVLLASLLFPSTTIKAANPEFVSIVNPIRGSDFWNHPQAILDTPTQQYRLIEQHQIPATWLVRYDALTDPQVEQFLKSLNSQQEVGIFMEVTPTLTSAAGVTYHQSKSWHDAGAVLLTGYSVEERYKLIDTVMERYKTVFDRYPTAVGAWWIDSSSLNYLKDKYGIIANLDVADQHSTDGYQVWGQYWSLPFYPAKRNALVPAGSVENKIGIVTTQWAPRDPFNGYGSGVFESTFSVQANDYVLHDLSTDYFKKLLTAYPFLTIGLENDFIWSEFGPEYARQLAAIEQSPATVLTMTDYARRYIATYPQLSPTQVIEAADPLGTNGRVVWYQNPKYRVGLFAGPYGVAIRDLRKYTDTNLEDCSQEACQLLDLGKSFVNPLDEVASGKRWVIDQGDITNWRVQNQTDGLLVTYRNQAGVDRQVKFLANDIQINDRVWTIDTFILEANKLSAAPIDQISLPFAIDWSKVIGAQLLSFAKFILFMVGFLVLPGLALSRRWSLAIPVGLVIFSLLSWLLGLINLAILLWAVPVISLVALIKLSIRPTISFKLARLQLLASLTILIGSMIWGLTNFKNGLDGGFGFGYWGAHGHDAIWHLSLISGLQQQVPPQNPIFAGHSLDNYHYFFDLLVAQTANLSWINIQDLLFRWYPLLISLLTGLMSYLVVKKLASRFKRTSQESEIAAIFSTFMVYFGGSFGWILTWLKDQHLGGESIFWAMQAISSLINPPFAISVVFLLAGYLVWQELLDQSSKFKNWWLVGCLVLLWGLLIEFKVYAGLLVLGSLGLWTFEQLIRRRDWQSLVIYGLIFGLSLAVFLPNNHGSNSLIVWAPGWFISSLINSPDRFDWPRLALILNSGTPYKVIVAYLVGLMVFLVGNFSTRLVAILTIPWLWKERFWLYLIIAGFVVPMLFIQQGTSWNTIQFFYYSQLGVALFTGLTLVVNPMRRLKWLQLPTILLIVLLTLPTTIGSLMIYLPTRPASQLPSAEIAALRFLSTQPDGIVLSLPYDPKSRQQFVEPVPLYAYASTAYVSAFSGKPSYLADTINLDILGIDYQGRLNDLQDFSFGGQSANQLLVRQPIQYIYLPKQLAARFDADSNSFKVIFENDQVTIYGRVTN